MKLQIECLYLPGCASRQTLPDRVAEAVAETGAEADVTHRVLSLADGERVGFRASPTVLINGHDILETPTEGVG